MSTYLSINLLYVLVFLSAGYQTVLALLTDKLVELLLLLLELPEQREP